MRGKNILRPNQLQNSRGIVLVWTALTMIVLLGMVALAVDLGFAYVISNELKSVADTGALEASRTYVSELRIAAKNGVPPDYTAIQAKVASNIDTTINKSIVINNVSLGAVNINLTYGTFTDNSKPYDEKVQTQFRAGVPPGTVQNPINSFRVTTSRNNSPAFFSRVLGFAPFPQTRNSVSMLAPRNFVLDIDTSGSMDDINYNPAPIAPPNPLPSAGQQWWKSDESFIITPRIVGDPDPTIMFSNTATATHPEPLQTVLNSSLQFLQNLVASSFFQDSAGSVYFSDRAVSKVNLQLLDKPSTDPGGVFSNLFSNNSLYNNLVPSDAAQTATNGGNSYFLLDMSTLTGAKTEPTVFDPFPDKYNLMSGQNNQNFAIPFGRTNIGASVNRATSLIKAATITARSIGVIILFTDGVPTCDGPLVANCYDEGASFNKAQLASSINYTFTQASAAIKAGVLIIPISYINFGVDPPGPLDITDMQKVKDMLDQIARLSGISTGHYNIQAPATPADIQKALDDIFINIQTLIPFFLVG